MRFQFLKKNKVRKLAREGQLGLGGEEAKQGI